MQSIKPDALETLPRKQGFIDKAINPTLRPYTPETFQLIMKQYQELHDQFSIEESAAQAESIPNTSIDKSPVAEPKHELFNAVLTELYKELDKTRSESTDTNNHSLMRYKSIIISNQSLSLSNFSFLRQVGSQPGSPDLKTRVTSTSDATNVTDKEDAYDSDGGLFALSF